MCFVQYMYRTHLKSSHLLDKESMRPGFYNAAEVHTVA